MSKKIRWGFLPLIIPSLLIYGVFFILPTFMSFFYSFTDWDGLSQTFNFVGFDNFVKIFTSDKRAFQALLRTFQYAAIICVIQNFLGLVFALLLEKNFFGRGFSKSVFFLPNVFNALVVGFVWSYIYDPNFGLFTEVFQAFGWNGLAQIQWFSKDYALYAICISMIWQFAGTSMIMYLAGLQSISTDLYEAAYIDGANGWQKLRKITLPLLAPSFTINIVWSFIGTMKIFDYIFVMTAGGPGDATQSVSTLLYDYALNYNKFGYGAALGMVLFVIIAVLSITMTLLLRKREVEM